MDIQAPSEQTPLCPKLFFVPHSTKTLPKQANNDGREGQQRNGRGDKGRDTTIWQVQR